MQTAPIKSFCVLNPSFGNHYPASIQMILGTKCIAFCLVIRMVSAEMSTQIVFFIYTIAMATATGALAAGEGRQADNATKS